LTIWDTASIFVVTYTCIMSMFYSTFGMTENPSLLIIEWVVIGFFTVDIFLNFMRVRKDKEGKDIRSHIELAKSYTTGWFLFDFLATFPFSSVLENENSTALKLIRLVRLPRIRTLFNLEKFKALSTIGSQSASR
jgi:heme/copper-type cytochrome/quinol oxidase subunit 4